MMDGWMDAHCWLQGGWLSGGARRLEMRCFLCFDDTELSIS